MARSAMRCRSPNGTYKVTLKFAENFFTAAGKRVFDVTAEGATVVNDLDIWTAAGGKDIAYDVPVTVQVTDGTLNLNFLAGVENPKVERHPRRELDRGDGNRGAQREERHRHDLDGYGRDDQRPRKRQRPQRRCRCRSSARRTPANGTVT